MEHGLFLQLTLLLALTVSTALVLRFLKQPLLVSYVIAGIISGPLFFNLLRGSENIYDGLAKLGVVLMLFIIGLEIDFSYLKKIGRVSLSIGLAQFVLNFALVFLATFYYLNFSLSSAFFLAIAACFSSTVVILKLLNDKKDEESVYGRYTIGLLLVQDLISIAILFCLSIFYPSEAVVFNLSNFIKAIFLILMIIFSHRYLLPKILDKIASSGEFLFIFTIAWCFGVASLMSWTGFSLELGAIIAGLTLGSSKYQPEIVSRVKPLRDFFIVIFFIVLGSLVDLSNFKVVLVPSLFLSLLIIIFRPLILYILFRAKKFTRRNSFLPALSSIPLCEFGFIILLFAFNAGAVSNLDLSIYAFSIIITIFISSYLINYNAQIYNFLLPVFNLFGRDKYLQKEEIKESFSALVFGYHRTGWKIGNALRESGLSFAAVDFNPENISRLKNNNIKMFFGDASDIEFLRALPLDKTKIIISTIPSPEDQLVLINYLRSVKKKVIIIATLYDKKYLSKLYEAGADYVMLPHLLSGAWMADLIAHKNVTEKKFLNKLKQSQKKELEGNIEHDKIKVMFNL